MSDVQNPTLLSELQTVSKLDYGLKGKSSQVVNEILEKDKKKVIKSFRASLNLLPLNELT